MDNFEVRKILLENSTKFSMLFLVKCPRCGHTMQYQCMTKGIFGKTKKCVYCGKSFSVKERVVKRLK